MIAEMHHQEQACISSYAKRFGVSLDGTGGGEEEIYYICSVSPFTGGGQQQWPQQQQVTTSRLFALSKEKCKFSAL